MMRGLPILFFGLMFLILATQALDTNTGYLIGFAMIIGGYKLYEQKRVDLRHDWLSSSGWATILSFIGLILFGIMFIFGSYIIPIIEFTISKTLMMWLGGLVFLFGFLDVNFKRR